MSSQNPPKLLTTTDYVDDVIRSINLAKDHICILSMIASYDSRTKRLFDAVVKARERGVRVDFAADIFSYSEIGGHLRFNTKHSKKVRPVEALKEKMRAVGIKIHWLGIGPAFLFSGRTHSKWLVVDNISYVFGGVNLYNGGISNNDFMLRFDDRDLASELKKEYDRIIQADKNGNKSHSRIIDIKYGQLLLDGGRIRDSIIYRHVQKLVAAAESVVYVSQYCPTGSLAKLLRKKNAKLYFNSWRRASSLNSLYIHFNSWKSGLDTIYKGKKYIHSKFIICTMQDGAKVAITGSHNFSNGGVWLGTREVALETREKMIVDQLESFLSNYVQI